jgi:hypothetical protein
VDAASITLSGANSEFIAGGTLIETSLISVSSGGILAIDGGRNFISGNTISDAGGIILQGGSFADASLTIATGGSFAGTGTITSAVLDNGRIEATGTALTVEGAITGAGSLLIDAHSALILGAGDVSGTNITFGGTHAVLGLDAPGAVFGTLVSLSASDTIDLAGTLVKSATIAGNQLVVSLTAGGVIDYALANPAANTRAAVVGDGNGGSNIVIFRQAQAGAISPTPVNLGEGHAGGTLSQTYTITNTAAVDPYSENLHAVMGATSANVIDSGTISALAPGATNSLALHASLVTGTAGVVSGTATVNLSTTGTGVNGDDGGTLALPSQTVSLTGTIFNYASAAIAPNPLSTGQHHVGDVITQFITIANSAAPGIYSENLDAKFSGTSSNLIGTGNFAGLAAGSTNSSGLQISLTGSSGGVKSGTATIGLTSDGGGIDTLGNTGITAQTVTVTGTLFNYATASAATLVNFGIVHVGSSVSNYLTISNTAATGKYSENLDASFSGTSTGITASGVLSELAAGAKSKNVLKLKLGTGAAGTITGTTTLGLTSDGKKIDTLGTTVLGGQVITVTGTVNNYATTAVETIAGSGTLTGTGSTVHLNLGSAVAGGAALSENIGVLNGATGPADLLAGSFSLSGSTLFSNTGIGSFTGLTAGGADTSPTISLGTGTIGTFQETIVVYGTGSNASGYSGTLTNETIIVAGTITAAPQFIAAAPSTATPAATPITGSDAVKAYAVHGLMESAPRFSSASPDVSALSASTVSLGAYTSTELVSTPSHAGLHAAIIAGLG